MIEKDQFYEKVKKAMEFVQKIEEPYKIAAFQVILNIFLREKKIIKGAEVSQIVETVPIPKISMVEFLNMFEFDTFVDFTLSFTYYKWKYESLESLMISDLTDCFEKTKTKKPKNLSDTINALIKKGFIAESGKKEGARQLYITQTGIKYIENMITNQ